jgi:hypothetical protein
MWQRIGSIKVTSQSGKNDTLAQARKKMPPYKPNNQALKVQS